MLAINNRQKLFFCTLALFTVCYSIILRTVPLSIPLFQWEKVLAAFALPKSAFSSLFNSYQYALLIGFILSGWAIKNNKEIYTLWLAVLAAVLAIAIFNHPQAFWQLLLSRFLLGLAHAVIFISILAYAASSLSKYRFAIFTALIFAAQLITPAISKPLLTAFLLRSSLNQVNNQLSGIGLIIVLCWMGFYFILSRYQPKTAEAISPNKRFCFARATLLASISCLGWFSNTFLLNWGAIYLKQNMDVLVNYAPLVIANSFICFAAGAILASLVARSTLAKRNMILIGFLLAAFSFTIVLYTANLTSLAVSCLFLLTSFFSGSAVLCYAMANDMSIFCSATIFSYIAFITTCGNMLFSYWTGKLLGAGKTIAPPLSVHAWHTLLIIIPMSLIIGGLLASILRKETI